MNNFNWPEPARSDNSEIAWLLRAVAAVYEVYKQDKFKAIAYRNAADEIEHLSLPLYHLWKQGRAGQVPHIGPSIRKHLEEYFKTGRSVHFDKLLSKLDPAVFYLMRIPGVGAKTAVKLSHHFSFPTQSETETIRHLIKLADQAKIRTLPGFGVVSELKIRKQAYDYLKQTSTKRLLLSKAIAIAQPLIDYLTSHADFVKEARVVGSLRRRLATVGDIDIAVKTNKPIMVIDALKDYPMFTDYEIKGETKARIITQGGWSIDVVTAGDKEYGSLLQHLTGSKFHNIGLRQLALDKGLSLSEHGIKRLSDKRMFYFSDETSLYNFLGLDYIPPELRENMGEIEAAQAGRLPNLIMTQDIKGDLHLHSSFDIQTAHDLGRASVVDMALKAKELGYNYMAVSDHNMIESLPLRLRRQLLNKRNRLIEQAERTTGLKIFKSLEVDIKKDGRLAIDTKLLTLVDFLIVGIHSGFDQGFDKLTGRIIKALRNPKVKILSHPTTRLLNHRPALKADWGQIFKLMAKHDQAVEVNACGQRLDLPVDLIRLAVDLGVKLVINSDAHSLLDMEQIKFGVWQARRAWVEAKMVVNCWPLRAVMDWIQTDRFSN